MRRDGLKAALDAEERRLKDLRDAQAADPAAAARQVRDLKKRIKDKTRANASNIRRATESCRRAQTAAGDALGKLEDKRRARRLLIDDEWDKRKRHRGRFAPVKLKLDGQVVATFTWQGP